jgi:putative ABC transport system permease protein
LMAKNPTFTAVAVTTLALGIGANTTVFTVVNAVLLRPIPYPQDPEQVLLLHELSARSGRISVSYPNYHDWKDQNQVFQTMAAYLDRNINLTGTGEPARIRARITSHDYFDIQVVEPLLGRFYSKEEDVPGGKPVAVINYSLWQGRFGGKSNLIGQSVTLNEHSYTIIGILPPNFELVSEERVYLPLEPLANNAATRYRGNHQGIRVLARLKQGVSFEQARSEMETISRRLEQQYPATNSDISATIDLLNEHRTRDYRSILLILQAAVGFVLMIACANVANLILARAANRNREIAIRSALGDGRARIARQLLTESLLIAVAGGFFGILIAQWGLFYLKDLVPANVPRLGQAELDWQVLAITIISCGAAGMLCGLTPALQGSPARLIESLKGGSGGSSSMIGQRHLGSLFLALQVSLATVLLIGAGLLIRTVHELTSIDLGFPKENLLTMRLTLPSSQYTPERRIVFLDRLRDNIDALPGVSGASFGLSLPVTGSEWGSIFIVGDKPVPPRKDLPFSTFNTINSDYFEVIGIPLLKGRIFSEFDTRDSQKVAVVNETLARHFWPDESAVGKRIKQGYPESQTPWLEIVGVVGDAKQDGLYLDSPMETYMPYPQRPLDSVKLAIRAAVDPPTLVDAVRSEVHELDPGLPVYGIETMDQAVSSLIAPRRFTMILFSIFSALAVVLAAIGIYGVVAYSVAQRTREMGLRIAIGARPFAVFRMVVGKGMTLATFGLLVGIVVALALARILSNLLYETSAADPGIFVLVPILLGMAALLACCIPAIRAMRVDPVIALRSE